MELEEVVQEFKAVSLEELNTVKLLNRTDTKYFFSIRDLPEVLSLMVPHYQILEIEGKRKFSYKSLYFDTPDRRLYTMHHNGESNRIKVRIRKYVDSGLTSLEVKTKVKFTRTVKKRIIIDDFEENLSDESRKFIAKNIHQDLDLVPSLWSSFSRLTFTDNDRCERITIDLNLNFKSEIREANVDDLVIVEVKQGRQTRESHVIDALRKTGHRPMRISKYCTGFILTHDGVKYNNFKRKLLKIEKIEKYGKSFAGD